MKKAATFWAALFTAATLNASQAPKNISPDENKPKIEVVSWENQVDSLAKESYKKALLEALDKKDIDIKSQVKELAKENEDVKKLINIYWEDVVDKIFDIVLDKLLQNPDKYIIIGPNLELDIDTDKLAKDSLQWINKILLDQSRLSFLIWVAAGAFCAWWITRLRYENH